MKALDLTESALPISLRQKPHLSMRGIRFGNSQERWAKPAAMALEGGHQAAWVQPPAPAGLGKSARFHGPLFLGTAGHFRFQTKTRFSD